MSTGEPPPEIDALYEQVVTGLKNLPLKRQMTVLTTLSRQLTQAGMLGEAQAANQLSSALGGTDRRRSSDRSSITVSDPMSHIKQDKLEAYLADHPAVIHYMEARNAFRHAGTPEDSTTLGMAFLQRILDDPHVANRVQVAMLNDAIFAKPECFALLLRLLALGRVWAVNLGETEFSAAQLEELGQALAAGGVGFLFVEEKYLSPAEKGALKAIIKANRDRRRGDGSEPWLLSEHDSVQNEVIRSLPCCKMWFGPLNLARNKAFEAARKEATRPSLGCAVAAASSEAASPLPAATPPPAAIPPPAATPALLDDDDDDDDDETPLNVLKERLGGTTATPGPRPGAPVPVSVKRELSTTSYSAVLPAAVRQQHQQPAEAGESTQQQGKLSSAAQGEEGASSITSLVKQLSIEPSVPLR